MPKSTRLSIFYEIAMASLAIVIVIILFIELTTPLTKSQEELLSYIDFSVLIIFAIDYVYRFIRAENKWVFFKSNIFDLIAIIPFDKAFRVARLVRLGRLIRLSRLTKVLKLLKLLRIAIFLKKSGNTLKDILKTNGLIYVMMATVFIVFLGALGIMLVESDIGPFSDSLWWSIVTTTTVGYGDISPKSTGGRVIACLLMIVGIGFLGMVTGSIATYFVSRLSKTEPTKTKSIGDEQIEYIKGKLDSIADLNQEEIRFLNQTIVQIWEMKVKIKDSKQ
jgi:voltage-gated potassium channel